MFLWYLVVGAGASAEFSLPAGAELKQKIAKGVHFRFRLPVAKLMAIPIFLTRLGDNLMARINSWMPLREPEMISPKLFLPFLPLMRRFIGGCARPEIVQFGKTCDRALHLGRGAKIPLAAGAGQINVRAASGTWLETFLSMAVSANDRDRVDSIFRNVTFINFNYDRLIEQYLYWGLQQLAGVSGEAAAKAISNLKMIRPYGTIGPPNIEFSGAVAKEAVPFGGGRGSDLFSIAKNIQTFTEQSEDMEIASLIDDSIEAASAVIFLGFGFHQQNLALFRPSVGRTRGNISCRCGQCLGY